MFKSILDRGFLIKHRAVFYKLLQPIYPKKTNWIDELQPDPIPEDINMQYKHVQ